MKEEKSMSRKCDICGKGHLLGHKISHAHNVSRKTQQPNLQVVRVNAGGGAKKVKACTRCIKAGKVFAQA
jgi:large subunit ribosomal protein L28